MLGRARLTRELRQPIPRVSRTFPQQFSTSKLSSAYEDTISSLKIGSHTRVIYQGFTGRVSTTNAQQSIEYGTNIVGGTTPGKEGEHLGLPLLPSVQKAAEQLKPDASAVFVAAHQAASAIEDAIAAGIPLIVAVAEFIPLHDMLRVSRILKRLCSAQYSYSCRYHPSSKRNPNLALSEPIHRASYHPWANAGSAFNRCHATYPDTSG